MDRIEEIRERLGEWGDKGATNEAAEDYRTDIPYLLERIDEGSRNEVALANALSTLLDCYLMTDGISENAPEVLQAKKALGQTNSPLV